MRKGEGYAHSDELVALERRHDLVQLLELQPHPPRQVVVLQTVVHESSRMQVRKRRLRRSCPSHLPLPACAASAQTLSGRQDTYTG